MNIFLIGTNTREHAIAWKIKKSPFLKTLYCFQGNRKIEEFAKIANCDPNNYEEIIHFCQSTPIDLVIIGPKKYLINGLADRLRDANIPVVGPSQKSAELIISKIFTKKFCKNFFIPTAKHKFFTKREEALDYLHNYANEEKKDFPIVIKTNKYVSGRRVIIAKNLKDAIQTVQIYFDEFSTKKDTQIIIEKFLEGEELSFFCLCDGKTAIFLGSTQNYKYFLDHNLSSKTQGMGVFSPAQHLDHALYEEIVQKIIAPTLEGLQVINAPFQGILCVDLMITSSGPYLLGYNLKLGNLQAQTILPLFTKDLLLFLNASTKEQLNQITDHTIYKKIPDPYLFQKNQFSLSVAMTTHGDPMVFKKHNAVPDLQKTENDNNTIIFYSNKEDLQEDCFTVSNDLVLIVTAWDATLEKAREKVYLAIEKIHWPDSVYRKEIEDFLN